jgi:hypothetical protein
MEFFLWETVAIAWKNLVHSSPKCILLTVNLFLQYKFLYLKSICSCLLIVNLKLKKQDIRVTLKIDFEKTNDIIGWDFVEVVLTKRVLTANKGCGS